MFVRSLFYLCVVLQRDLTITERPVLFVSTLDGTMYCVYKDTGEVKWSFKDGALLFLLPLLLLFLLFLLFMLLLLLASASTVVLFLLTMPHLSSLLVCFSCLIRLKLLFIFCVLLPFCDAVELRSSL